MSFDKIAIVKVGWSSNQYQGGYVLSKTGYAKEHKKKDINGLCKIKGHEAYNFKEYKGKCFAYIPPTAGYAPNPKEKNGWLVIFISRKSSTSRFVPVGWFEDASFVEDYKKRPEYKKDEDFPKDAEEGYFTFCLKATATNVYCIPKDIQQKLYLNDELANYAAHPSIVYAKGNKTNKEKKICKEFERYAIKVVKTALPYANRKENRQDSNEIMPPPTDLKKQIENTAIKYATEHYEDYGYIVESVESENCGWDLTIKKRNGEDYLHLEVKGTDSSVFQFFLSRNEYDCMQKDSLWKLFIVKNALKKNKKHLKIKKEKVSKYFSLEPICFKCDLKEEHSD